MSIVDTPENIVSKFQRKKDKRSEETRQEKIHTSLINPSSTQTILFHSYIIKLYLIVTSSFIEITISLRKYSGACIKPNKILLLFNAIGNVVS